ncbi:cobalt-precorrin-6A reductase [Pelagibius litoralis]|uniref:Cobalt-precorrin-6A reductase n=1 Tax=Pelagibius litoralis TaxID=374515 RepID=A0A967CCM7_9PROT|nr:cobalt-precorrin-6A reductase [Pelagibius litoralis]NIA69164.1 cobalt-precorrin-6A reductase [Pelagibius litoralis]
MAEAHRILLLGGTNDSRELAERLAERDGIEVITSLAGRTEHPLAIPGSLRIGGFGGVEALTRYLAEEHIDLLVDATHPFAERISDNAAAACCRSGTPRLVLSRPPWQAVAGDHWITVADAKAAARALAGRARRVFLSVGRQELEAFEALTDIWFLVRMIDAPRGDLPLRNYEVVLGRGPFEANGERALLLLHGIQALVAKNSGGEATYAKIAVARELGLPVVMIERPVCRKAETATSVDDALSWIAARL